MSSVYSSLEIQNTWAAGHLSGRPALVKELYILNSNHQISSCATENACLIIEVLALHRQRNLIKKVLRRVLNKLVATSAAATAQVLKCTTCCSEESWP